MIPNLKHGLAHNVRQNELTVLFSRQYPILLYCYKMLESLQVEFIYLDTTKNRIDVLLMIWRYW
jgi:hypothetical protein